MDALIHFIQHLGYLGYFIMFLVIFLESLPFAFFLPGDSMLLTTGFLATQGYFSLSLLFAFMFVGSVLGYFVSYAVGKKFRHLVIRKGDNFWFKKKHLEKTHAFFQKYGRKTIIFGRFVAIVRSFTPALAGAGLMQYGEFALDSIIGGILWVGGLLFIGFYLGRTFPGLHLHLTPIILAIILVSLIPAIYEYTRNKKKNKMTL